MANIVITDTGPLWTLEEVKAHLRIEADETEENGLINAYMEAAERALLRFCNLSLVPLHQEAVFKQAGFLTVAAFYQNRAENESGIPSGARALISPYRLLGV